MNKNKHNYKNYKKKKNYSVNKKNQNKKALMKVFRNCFRNKFKLQISVFSNKVRK